MIAIDSFSRAFSKRALNIFYLQIGVLVLTSTVVSDARARNVGQHEVGFAISKADDRVFAWNANGTVSSGTSTQLDQFLPPYVYNLPNGKTALEIVGMGLSSTDDRVYVWYKDGSATSGSSHNLNKHPAAHFVELPTGKNATNIVGMAISQNDRVYAWFDDGTVSAGTVDNITQASTTYSVANGKSVDDIGGMAISKNGRTYTWYKDGDVSSGTITNLAAHYSPQPYSSPPYLGGAKTIWIKEYTGDLRTRSQIRSSMVAVAHSDNHPRADFFALINFPNVDCHRIDNSTNNCVPADNVRVWGFDKDGSVIFRSEKLRRDNRNDGDPWPLSEWSYHAKDIVVTDSAFYIVGSTILYDKKKWGDSRLTPRLGFLAKFDVNGNRLWIRQFGDQEALTSIDADNQGQLFFASHSYPEQVQIQDRLTLSYSAHVTKFDPNVGGSGTVIWRRDIKQSPLRAQYDMVGKDFRINDIVETGGMICVAGVASAPLAGTTRADVEGLLELHPIPPPTGPFDPDFSFVRVLDGDTGAEQWTDQFRLAERSHGEGCGIDDTGHVYVAGTIYGDIAVEAEKLIGGKYIRNDWIAKDLYLRRYMKDGRVHWTTQFGSLQGDKFWDLEVTPPGYSYLVGETKGRFSAGWYNLNPDTKQRSRDPFVVRISPFKHLHWVDQLDQKNQSSDIHIPRTYSAIFGLAVTSGSKIFVVGTSDYNEMSRPPKFLERFEHPDEFDFSVDRDWKRPAYRLIGPVNRRYGNRIFAALLAEGLEGPSGTCNDYYDNDADGKTDLEDEDCQKLLVEFVEPNEIIDGRLCFPVTSNASGGWTTESITFRVRTYDVNNSPVENVRFEYSQSPNATEKLVTQSPLYSTAFQGSQCGTDRYTVRVEATDMLGNSAEDSIDICVTNFC